MPNEIGSLDRAILTAQNKLSQLLSLLAPGETDNVAIRMARNAVDKAKLAKQAATGSQQGLSNLPRSIAGSAAGPLAGAGSFMPPVGSFVTPELAEQFPGMNRILNAPSPLDLALTQLLPSIFGRGAGQAQTGLQPYQQESTYGNLPPGVAIPFSSPPISGGMTPGGRQPMPTATSPVRFLPNVQGSKAYGTPMDIKLPGGGTRPPVPQGPKPTPRSKPKPAPGSRARRV